MSKSVSFQRPVATDLLEYAAKIRNSGELCDAHILVDKKAIPANRLVLSCFSSYFESMIKLNKQMLTFEIEALDATTVELLIDYIYCGNITITTQNVVHVFSGAVYLELNDVALFCLEFLQTNFEPRDLLSLLKSQKLLGNVSLKRKMEQYISPNLFKVTQTEGFKALSSEELETCFFNLHQFEIDEESIYAALISWARHNREVREIEFWRFFQEIRVDLLTISLLEEVVLKEDLVKNNADCHTQALTTLLKLVEVRNSHSLETHLLSVGGFEDPTQVSVVLITPPVEVEPNYPEVPRVILKNCVLKAENSIYCIGGMLDKSSCRNASDEVLELSLKQKDRKWEKVSSMNEKRFAMGASEYCDCVVVVGGANENDNLLSTSEIYSSCTNEWKPGSPLSQTRAYHALVSCNGCLYAVGGLNISNRLFFLASVEKLEGLQGTWETIQSMKTPRYLLAAVNCNGVVYAIGGKSGEKESTALNSVEKYHPASNQWTYVSGMIYARYGHAACVLRGKIYVVGGKNKNGDFVQEIECYNPENDSWSFVKNANEKLVCHSLVAL